MTHLLDTDHVSILQQEAGPDHGILLLRLSEYAVEDVGCCVVSLHEQMNGANTRIVNAKTLGEVVAGYRIVFRILDRFRRFPLVPFDDVAAAEFARLRKAKVRIGTMDLRIAATALSRGLTLVTRNRSDFDRVPGLALADWTR